MKIKKGDIVKVIAGNDRGKTGKVVRAFPSEDKVVVEDVRVVKKHQRARERNQKGQIIERPTPIHVSNVKIVSGKDTASKKSKKAKKAKQDA